MWMQPIELTFCVKLTEERFGNINQMFVVRTSNSIFKSVFLQFYLNHLIACTNSSQSMVKFSDFREKETFVPNQD